MEVFNFSVIQITKRTIVHWFISINLNINNHDHYYYCHHYHLYDHHSLLLASVFLLTRLWGRRLGLLWRLAPKHTKEVRSEDSGDSLGSEMDDYNK